MCCMRGSGRQSDRRLLVGRLRVRGLGKPAAQRVDEDQPAPADLAAQNCAAVDMRHDFFVKQRRVDAKQLGGLAWADGERLRRRRHSVWPCCLEVLTRPGLHQPEHQFDLLQIVIIEQLRCVDRLLDRLDELCK